MWWISQSTEPAVRCTKYSLKSFLPYQAKAKAEIAQTNTFSLRCERERQRESTAILLPTSQGANHRKNKQIIKPPGSIANASVKERERWLERDAPHAHMQRFENERRSTQLANIIKVIDSICPLLQINHEPFISSHHHFSLAHHTSLLHIIISTHQHFPFLSFQFRNVVERDGMLRDGEIDEDEIGGWLSGGGGGSRGRGRGKRASVCKD